MCSVVGGGEDGEGFFHVDEWVGVLVGLLCCACDEVCCDAKSGDFA